MYLIFDTETTGLPKNYNAPITDVENWPRAVQIAWQLHDKWGKLIAHQAFLIQPDDFDIPYDAERIHGISTALAQTDGKPLSHVLESFNEVLSKAEFVVGQNISFDLNIMGAEYHRKQVTTDLFKKKVLDTCTEKTAELCQIPGGRGGKFKLPTLTELHQYLFQTPFIEAHNATADVEATARCFFELIRTTTLFSANELQQDAAYFTEFNKKNTTSIQSFGLQHDNLKKLSQKLQKETSKKIPNQNLTSTIDLTDVPFVHLHNHTQFSVLQATTTISDLITKTIDYDFPAVALTDLGNMMGAFQFVKEISNYNKKQKEKEKETTSVGKTFTAKPLIPIVGQTLYVCENHLDKQKKDNGYQMVFLAKNKKGYHNLAKLSSIAFIDGFYYVPRVDKNLICQYKEDLIVLTGNLNGEIASKILNIGEKQAEEALLWWKKTFGDDLYLEIMRHGQINEDRANKTLIEFAHKHHVKLVATNNTYYIQQNDAEAHDILLCVKDNEKKDTPIGQGRGFRFGLENQEYYYKTGQQMKKLFADLPEAILAIQEIVAKIEPYELTREVLLPKFDIPQRFIHADDALDEGKRGENAYLKHLTFEGARQKYKENFSTTIQERLDFELTVIEKTGYPGYFLIVEDFCREAREMGVSVGPGRGSAAGSAVAYCLGITNIDPIKYDLLFERFLNPDRVSMPDIDIDFDDEGRQRVIDYVINKYGANQVSQIITYGTMAAKSAIRDTARVLDLDLRSADRLAKLVPDMKLKKLFALKPNELKEKLAADLIPQAQELLHIATGKGGTLLEEKTINQALILEGSLRNTGVHACGVIITPDAISNFVPIARAKDSEGFVTQFDNAVVESAGLLKMDFLGLKTLTLIKDTLKIIQERHHLTINPDEIPIDDAKTYQLFQRGETIGIFQYESLGMQKHMRDLKPTVFADLIAMNALYRPGPMEYIPSFIKRKHGLEPITYDLDACEEYLKETYGVTVYQEQVMLLSQKLANFTKGEADQLRKAMGKKVFAILDQLRPQFITGGKKNGHDEKILNKIWKDWEAFASYAFNKSHSTCYAWIAYQTAYLKANYPSEYMAAVLSNNMNDIKQVSFFMEECKRMNIKVLGPNLNESAIKFTVNEQGAIRFGMGAIKGVGENAVECIIKERKMTGNFTSVFDLVKRVDLRLVNKRVLENLVLAGALDNIGLLHRAQYFIPEKDSTTLEKILRFGQKFQENNNSAQFSLFGDVEDIAISEPIVPNCTPWPTMYMLNKEKEVVGIYITAHPLDDFQYEINHLTNINLEQINGKEAELENKELVLAGMVTDVQHRVSQKNGNEYGILSLTDYNGTKEFMFFGEDYLKFKHFLVLDRFLIIRLNISKRKWGDGWQYNYKSVELLETAFEKMVKQLTIVLDITQITPEKIEFLNEITIKHPGKMPLRVVVLDELSQIQLQMISRTKTIHIDKNLLQELQQHEIKRFSLN